MFKNVYDCLLFVNVYTLFYLSLAGANLPVMTTPGHVKFQFGDHVFNSKISSRHIFAMTKFAGLDSTALHDYITGNTLSYDQVVSCMAAVLSTEPEFRKQTNEQILDHVFNVIDDADTVGGDLTESAVKRIEFDEGMKLFVYNVMAAYTFSRDLKTISEEAEEARKKPAPKEVKSMEVIPLDTEAKAKKRGRPAKSQASAN